MQPKIDKEALKQIAPKKEQLEAQGIPTGMDKESAKKRLLKLFEEAGVISALKTPAEQQEFAMQLDELTQLILDKKFKELENHPLMQKLNQVLPQQAQSQMPQQVQEKPAATKDFASMMPPSGGGLPGR